MLEDHTGTKKQYVKPQMIIQKKDGIIVITSKENKERKWQRKKKVDSKNSYGI